MTNDPVVSLRAILARERAALMTGDYAHLNDFAEEKDRLLPQIAATRPSRDALGDLQRAMAANQALCAAALRGVRSAKARLDALAQVEATLTTYDRDGTIDVRAPDHATFERKA